MSGFLEFFRNYIQEIFGLRVASNDFFAHYMWQNFESGTKSAKVAPKSPKESKKRQSRQKHPKSAKSAQKAPKAPNQ